MEEIQIKAVIKNIYTDEAKVIIEFHKKHGGSPTIIGVVAITMAKTVPRYKLQFPDGFIDYTRVDTFNTWYTMRVDNDPDYDNNGKWIGHPGISAHDNPR